MSDPTDDPRSPDPALRFDDLLGAIGAALAQEAGAEVRSAGALACRAILGVLDPTSRSNAPLTPAATSPTAASPIATLLGALGRTPPTTSPAAASPVAALLGAVGQLPREQLIEAIVGGLRSLLTPNGATYLTRPMPTPKRPPEGGGP
jgi:hypothetical protein